jgi:catechol 2,3-dioxygenase-like lactoylglutathione lyase family enzyme
MPPLLRLALGLAISLSPSLIRAGAAAPVPGPKSPVDVRRATLLVRDMEKSLAFWRDGLGLTVVYNQTIGDPKNPEGQVHLCLLRANDDFVGLIGLMQRMGLKHPKPVTYEKATPPGVIIVLNAQDLEERVEKVRKVPGVRFETEPHLIEYPGPDAKSPKIPVMVTTVWDPDGYYVEVNKILGKPAGTQD